MIGTYYNRCWLNIERNNHGHAVIIPLFRLYPYLWHKEIFTSGLPKLTDQIGFQTGDSSKKIIIGELGRDISIKPDSAWIDKSETFWKETLTFVQEDGVMEAQGKRRGQRCYDDTVMATAIMLWTNSRLPIAKYIRKTTPLKGWRADMMKEKKQEQLVGWTV